MRSMRSAILNPSECLKRVRHDTDPGDRSSRPSRRGARSDADIGLVQLRAGRCLLDLVPVDGALGRAGGAAPGKEGRNLDHFCFRIDPFDEDEIRNHLAAHGVEAGEIASRYGAEGQGTSIYVKDPEGNVVELKGPAIA